MRQTSFFPSPTKEHGGVLSVKSRRARRPLSTREALHLTLRSELAVGNRSLLRHKDIIISVMKKAERHFRVRIYRFAICGNHVHLLIRGKTRRELQNFFRVLAGHIAQMILKRLALTLNEKKEALNKAIGCKKNQRKFWSLLTYTRVVSWGAEFKRVANYIAQNTLEALHIIAYRPRTKRRGRSPPS
jgi:REP element-mobilizing transposase RayT